MQFAIEVRSLGSGIYICESYVAWPNNSAECRQAQREAADLRFGQNAKHSGFAISSAMPLQATVGRCLVIDQEDDIQSQLVVYFSGRTGNEVPPKTSGSSSDSKGKLFRFSQLNRGER